MQAGVVERIAILANIMLTVPCSEAVSCSFTWHVEYMSVCLYLWITEMVPCILFNLGRLVRFFTLNTAVHKSPVCNCFTLHVLLPSQPAGSDDGS